MRLKTLQQLQITRSQFLRPYTRFPVNRIAVEPSAALSPVVPYVGKTGFTPTDSFYKHVSHETVQIDAAHWHLHVSGLVSQPSNFSLDTMQAMSAVEMPCTLTSITSQPNNLLIGHALWKGVPFKALLDQVGLRSEAQYAQFRSVNGYATYLPIDALEDAVLAYAMNGESLPAEQGYPARLIVPGVYDYKMPKWIQSMELVAAPSSGHYESRGWSAEGNVQTTSALFTPRLREVVNGKVLFSGMAFAGTRTISSIELSIDDGEWMPVPFTAAERGAWTRWQIEWQPHAPGDYVVKVRATDSEGFTQPDSLTLPLFPNGSSAIHAVVFRVSM
ncbi:MAG: molybdopterin-dependent oxidoreductase [Anaerolineae bacterium]|nr:molybdopterin-dependent oxidoreductase [Anaerolineae bacterium]